VIFDLRCPLHQVRRAAVLFPFLGLCGSHFASHAADSWPAALAAMPLNSAVRQLNRTNCVELMLRAFQSNAVVKALIFMPGATDEFYMFRRARATLTNAAPSLIDAVAALTNQTLIRATFQPPVLLLHTHEDPLEPNITVQDQSSADKLRQTRMVPHMVCNDRDWDYLQPLLRGSIHLDLRPWRGSYDSWHFYRHSFAAWGLTGWEALETAALAGKSRFTVQRKRVVFEVDPRVRVTPKPDGFPAR
jgi:hypothetical protein